MREGEREMRMMVYSWQPVTVSKVSPVTALACCHTLVACPEPHSSDVQAYTHARTRAHKIREYALVMNKPS